MRNLLAVRIMCLGIIACAGAVHAQSDCSKIVPAPPFGPDDQMGAINRVTPAASGIQ